MKCPICNKEAQVSYKAVHNAERYGHSNLVRLKCCGKLANLIPKFSYQLVEYIGDRKKDDWGE